MREYAASRIERSIEIIKIEQSAEIQRPIGEIYGFLSDLENWSLWQPDLRESEQISRRSMEMGATFRQTLDIKGKRVKLLCEVTGYEPNEKLSFACDREDVSLALDFALEPVDDGTRLTVRGEGRLSGFYSLLEPLVDREANEQVKTNLHNLKNFLEARAPNA